MDVDVSGIIDPNGSAQRRQRSGIITASNPSYPVPAFAQGGKGTVFVTGCGGGQSGAVGASVWPGIGGAAAGWAMEYPIPIPAGVTTLALVIGLGGFGPDANGNAVASAGGETSITVGGFVLRLRGGGQDTAIAGVAGIVLIGQVPTRSLVDNGNQFWGGTTGRGLAPALNGRFGSGAEAAGQLDRSPYGMGAYSLFGAPGFSPSRPSSFNSITTYNGAHATGYGAGGEGAWYGSQSTTATAGNGSPGFLSLEFVEGE